ncbi:hypothetical protein [Rariglobus hedericola]|uniref:Uncharacterized protein n=1 Tax=Rariglobus hedericola TaxID=2597822 RepID=A0A556QET7_9BACT|nr:hypothetical protein [Rariglobus hedericola]TSJ75131.1 hypothetical protein FPL22_17185 [Rariglobus hedericola]
MSDSTKTPSSSGSLLTVAAAIGGFAIFALIVFIAYLPKKPDPLPDGVRTPEQRKAALADLRAKEKAAATSYGWVDQNAGIVRIPIDEAVAITIKEINAKK